MRIASRRDPLPFPAILLAGTVLLSLFVSNSAQAQSATDVGYRTPDPAIVDLVDALPTPAVYVGPQRDWMLLVQYPSYPPIAELAERELRLAGMRIKPAIDGRSRTTGAIGLAFKRLSDGGEAPVTGLPEDARIENIDWSPDGRRIAFTNTTADGIELWMADVESARARRLSEPTLSLTAGNGPVWLSDGESLIVSLVPANRGAEPAEPRVPEGPVIEESLGRKAPARTYQDLLENQYDETLFDYYFTTQLARVSLDGSIEPLGEAGIIWEYSPSPDGRYLLVHRIHRPYSYRVPAYRFPQLVQIRDLETGEVRDVIDVPLQDEIPIAFGSVQKGPRSFAWRADAPATLVWVEAQDGGDAGVEAEIRDKVFMRDVGADGQPLELATLGYRYGGISWGSDELAMLSEFWWKTRQLRVWRVHPGDPGAAPLLLQERSYQDRYADPGSPVMEPNEYGRYVIRTTDGGRSAFLVGAGASPEGDRPFIDRFDLESGETTRLFRSEAPWYEQPVDVIDEEGRYVLTRRESVDVQPNYFVRDLESGELRQVTDFPNPTPQLEGIQKELVVYERADGVGLSGTLYLPPGYTPDQGPLPTLMWAYPTEYKSADAAGQVSDSPFRFARASAWSPFLWVMLGYAVFDDPSLPIIGEGDEEPNDTYVEQLVAGAEAAVDVVAAKGVTDRNRVAIGGHSYGAFMTANLLAHSDLFAAGIARSGAYNRTLTPFGFQSEERTYWEAPEVYYEMSPFMHADQVNEPILLIHGELDNNSGTFPLQSERFYGALQGLGATVRLVVLPYEAH
ncbi:MAG: prolyl oligopeptidase family serine peptidase, partial [Candidatus Palauibacterales bacterium]|nr:prolyl oligopeptidase family serine peptidase [Candidatus Palauibacterales bacterium]